MARQVGWMVAAVVCAMASTGWSAPIYVSLDSVQTGGFYGGGIAPNNDPAFQNYFVGYGTSPGSARTPERRSFFVFDLSGISSGIVSADLVLKLPFGGLIFGKGPGDPAVDVIPSNPTEEFFVGITPFPSAVVTSPSLTPAAIEDVFDSFIGVPVGARAFGVGAPPLTGDSPYEIVIPLSPAAIGALNAGAGAEIVFTGWMPTWSEDSRTKPGEPDEFFEGSELIFGFTDVHVAPDLLKPRLELAYVPEPGSVSVLALGGFAFAARRSRRAPRV